ncbi:SET domain-containing protein-lysine N-methyltransferase [Hyphomonas sp.]|uniref:SET domain-containing protein n=1 Tax=Hyphomonas sp. TaxID=87 RepID=UPI0025BCFC65|nr:SET domain-containing protein-lysine N-methyltransferase [Hyphomonas sp.]
MPMEKTGYASPVEVRQSPFHGRGLFAAVSFEAGDLIATYPLLVLSQEDTAAIRGTQVHHYVFHVDENEQGQMRAAVAFGLISMCNHSVEANADFTVDPAAQTVTLSARTPILADAEILIDYEEFADQII